MKRFLLLAAVSGLLVGCSASTGGSSTLSLTCEQRFDAALTRGVPYTEALGSYTQCLVDRGDTVGLQEAVSL